VARPSALNRLPRASLGAVTGYVPFALIMAGGLGLIVSELLVLREIRTITVVPRGGTVTGGAHHAYALAVIGVALLVMGVGAGLRRARPAAVACVVLSAAAAFVVLAIDLPGIDDAGIFAETYDLAQAHPSTGFYVESAAAALGLIGSVWALLLSGPVGRRRPRRERAARERSRAARRSSD
jgi:hypothetical protein